MPDSLTDEEFERLYGPWDALDPAGARVFLADFPAPWWVVGGWAIEAFTGVSRAHEDLDVVIFRRDLPLLQELVGDRYHLWGAGAGALRPLTRDWPELHEHAGQVWLREHAQAPWILDCILNDERDGQWVSRRDPDHVAPLEDVTWVHSDGVRYQRPEIVLQHKARPARPKDLADLRAAWPLLGTAEQAWLRDGVRREDPAHPWLDLLEA